MKKACLSAAVLAMSALMGASQAQADVLIFDDANGTGWSRQWYTPTQATYVHTGTVALESSNSQFRFDHAGLVDSDNYILEFYANTKDTTASTGIIVELYYVLADTTVEGPLPFDNRNVPVTYVVDGVDVLAGTSGKGVASDTDTGTWQKFQVDLSQTTYTGFPFVAHNYVPGSSSLTRITIKSASGSITNMVVDDVRLIGTGIPEPASLAMLGLGGLLMVKRRRA